MTRRIITRLFCCLAFWQIHSNVQAQVFGTPDLSFGTGGKTDTRFEPTVGTTDIEILPDGRVVTLGHGLMRYLANGILDTTFGTRGYAWLDSTAPIQPSATAIAIQSTGKIIVAGVYWNALNASPDIVLFRCLQNGRLDSTFGVNGMVTLDIDSLQDVPLGVAVGPNDRIIVASQLARTNPIHFQFSVTAFLSNGSLDTSFSHDGRVGLEDIIPGAEGNVGDVRVLTDGSILLAAWYGTSMISTAGMAVFKLKPDGAPETTFGSGGVSQVNWNFSERGQFLEIDAAGRIILCGYTLDPWDPQNTYHLLAARMSSSGALDPAFGVGGVAAFSGIGDEMGAAGTALDGHCTLFLEIGGGILAVDSIGNKHAGYGTNGVIDQSEVLFGRLATQPDSKLLSFATVDTAGGAWTTVRLARYTSTASAAVSSGDHEAYQVTLSPNPATASFLILGPALKGSVQVITSGGVVCTQQVLSGAGQDEILISNKLAAGTYVVQVKYNDGCVAKRVLVVH